MGLYQRVLVPRLVNWACSLPLMNRWRAMVCAGLVGDVLEVGFGTGLNVPHYPTTVTRVFAVEPSDESFALAAGRIGASSVRIERVGLDGHALALADESCDAALITFTLCTVTDPAQVLDEVRRVLRPGASLHFLEHGIAPIARVARWQRWLDPIEKVVADGCHLTRDAPALVRAAGFDLVELEQGFASGPRPWSYFSVGRARR
ncbi:MAG TPA: class I SAM-dependent methyltransferase [Acidimicrobiales bacterium]|nr:class I SAM-dependent methyltransferase [Acidimicrobiales bacterium]